MRVTIIICTFNRLDDLTECLMSFLLQFRKPDEIIIVDDGDIEKTKSVIEKTNIKYTIKDIKHVKGIKKGLPAARNVGIKLATGYIVCFIDDDVIVPQNWLKEILRAYKETDADGVGGSVLDFQPIAISKGNLNSFLYRILTAFRLLFFYNKVGRISPMGILYATHSFITADYKEVDTFMGVNMSFKKDVFDKYKFDRYYSFGNVPAIYEEVDFCTRLSRDRKKLIYNPKAIIIHKRTISGGERNKRTKSRHNIYEVTRIRNLVFYMLKYNMKPNLILFLIYPIVLTFCRFSLIYLNAVKEGIELYELYKADTVT